MHEDALRSEFTRQSETFGASEAARSAVTSGTLLDQVPDDPQASWLEVACGPATLSRTLAGRVGSVHGVDLTPAMVERARAEAAAEGLGNATFSLGDATALELGDASFDGALTRFSLHHIPLPGRALAEVARVVRPGGTIVVSDLVTDSDPDAAAWREEIERLRDPSHWACLTPARLRALGAAAGLRLEHDEEAAFDLDFDDWLARGSGGRAASELIERSTAARPEGAPSFRVDSGPGGRRLVLRLALARWSVPAAPASS